ncbi:protein NO VEIN domain-containing protein [Antrihabitans sp. NCIMB 15449]|uniref:Protein NO VEIN domain-containing protein n=1 Tax=Antrihabitans spumae TaxID=3373370 RepID=A0ABW7JWN8_9NOCA
MSDEHGVTTPAAAVTLLVTWNVDRWDWGRNYTDAVVQTSAGVVVEESWSTGGRTSGVAVGDRVFMLRQGSAERGLVASGTIAGDIYQAPHWDDAGDRLANYVAIEWDTVLPPEELLPTEELVAAFPIQHWRPQGSGILVRPEIVHALERLWTQHLEELGRGSGGGRQPDPRRRRKVEVAAQQRLMDHFSAQGWRVDDTHVGNPYDAMATRDSERIYLEAKGTESDGDEVQVTHGEVVHARNHPGECVMGIWSGITFHDEEVDPDSGDFRVITFDPDRGMLTPISYRWKR